MAKKEGSPSRVSGEVIPAEGAKRPAFVYQKNEYDRIYHSRKPGDVRTGSLIGLGFGILWWLVGAGAAAGLPGTVLQVLGVLIFAAAGIWIIRRKPRPARGKPRWTYYVVAIVVEIVAIALAQAWLTARGLRPLLFPVIGMIVGLHFTGLWPAFARRRFLVLAGAMTAINLSALLLPLAPGTRLMLSGFGSSACLLATALLP